VQEQHREGDGERQEHRPAAYQSRARAPTPLAQRHVRDNNRCVDDNANADGDAPPLFRRASHNLAAAAMLLRGCPEAATPEERRV
jgi:hypothetical protein